MPQSPYAASKIMGEYYCRQFTDLYGLSTVSLRYFNVFGPRQNPESIYSAVIPIFIDCLLKGISPEIHWDGKQSRDHDCRVGGERVGEVLDGPGTKFLRVRNSRVRRRDDEHTDDDGKNEVEDGLEPLREENGGGRCREVSGGRLDDDQIDQRIRNDCGDEEAEGEEQRILLELPRGPLAQCDDDEYRREEERGRGQYILDGRGSGWDGRRLGVAQVFPFAKAVP